MHLIQDNTELVSKLKSESVIDEELLLFLGLFHYVTSFIYVHYEHLTSQELDMIEKCGEFWIQLHKKYYDFRRMEVKIRYLSGKDLYDQLLTFGNYFIEYATKNNFPTSNIVAPIQFVAQNFYIYSPKHDLKKAMTLINQCENLLKDEDSKHIWYLGMVSAVYWTKGEINYLTGDFDSALTNLQEALRFLELSSKKSGNSFSLYIYLEDIGKVYNAIGSYELALKYHLEVLRLRTFERQAFLHWNMSNFSVTITHSYYQLINTYLFLNRKAEAMKYFEKLEKIFTSLDHPFTVKARYNISKSLILLHEGLFKDIAEAKELLKEVIAMPLYFELISDVLIPLIEIVVQEYKISHSQRSLQEFNQLSTVITSLYEKNNSIFLQINFLILQGKIAFINGDYNTSKSFYEKALSIAKDFDRLELVKKIKSEIELIQKYNLHNQNYSTTNSRFNLVEIENYVKEAFQVIKNQDEE